VLIQAKTALKAVFTVTMLPVGCRILGYWELKNRCLDRVPVSPLGVSLKTIANIYDLDNVNQFTKTELVVMCNQANHRLRVHCMRKGFKRYPCISVTRATPQQMRGWLLYHFPQHYYNGPIERGAIAGRIQNRGVEVTPNGTLWNGAGKRVAGFRIF